MYVALKILLIFGKKLLYICRNSFDFWGTSSLMQNLLGSSKVYIPSLQYPQILARISRIKIYSFYVLLRVRMNYLLCKSPDFHTFHTFHRHSIVIFYRRLMHMATSIWQVKGVFSKPSGNRIVAIYLFFFLS